MSLRGQFFLSVLLALLVTLSLLAAVACWHARRSVQNEMAMALEAADRIVDNALISLPRPLAGGTDADAYLVRLTRSFDDNRHVRVALRKAGRTIAVSRLASAGTVPAWYRRLLEIPTDTRLDDAPQLGGYTLAVSTDAHNEIGESWVQFRDGAALLALFALLMLGLVHLAMNRIAGPLARLGRGFDRVGGGDYGARVPLEGPREVGLLAEAFNRMTQRLGALEADNRRLTQQTIAIQEEERADIARDLHDEMGPFLFAMRVDADAIAAAARAGGHGAIAGRAAALGQAVGHIQRHVRSILRQLRSEGLAETGLVPALTNLATFWQRRHDGVRLHLDIGAVGAGFGADADAALYRFVQEGLTNAVRHGGARNAWLTVTAGTAVHVVLEDDGAGLKSGGTSGDEAGMGGMGLKGMRERLAPLSGTLTLTARAQGGARLEARIPLGPQQAAAE
jgi:two-component system sensor histidine kinase UhpB